MSTHLRRGPDGHLLYGASGHLARNNTCCYSTCNVSIGPLSVDIACDCDDAEVDTRSSYTYVSREGFVRCRQPITMCGEQNNSYAMYFFVSVWTNMFRSVSIDGSESQYKKLSCIRGVKMRHIIGESRVIDVSGTAVCSSTQVSFPGSVTYFEGVQIRTNNVMWFVSDPYECGETMSPTGPYYGNSMDPLSLTTLSTIDNFGTVRTGELFSSLSRCTPFPGEWSIYMPDVQPLEYTNSVISTASLSFSGIYDPC